ncbi:MAG: hypothetical protein ABGX14_05720 [bacterium]
MGGSQKMKIDNSAIMRTGVVLPKKHPTDPTKYYVNFGEKTADLPGKLDSGVWCANGISSFVRYRNANNNPVSYGSYTAIQPYTPVNVLMSAGGLGVPTIIGFTNTNTSVPDTDNVDDLFIAAQSPGGSIIEIDDKVGAINLMYDQGSSMLSLANDVISLELNKGVTGGKEFHTGISMRKGAIKFRNGDSTMQFDESGLSISFDDGGTSMRITKKGVTFEGMDVFKVASEEQVSIKGSKMTLEGTKDASLTASELKVGGKQLTSITGSQINIESIFGTTLKSMAVNVFALAKWQVFAGLSDTTILGADVRTAGTISEASGTHNIVTGAFNVGAGMVAMDFNLITTMGIGLASATAVYTASKATTTAVHAALTVLGTSMILKTTPITAVNKILADTLAGASEPAQEPSGNAAGTRDKNQKKTFGSVTASKFQANNTVMEKYSVVPGIVAEALNKKGLGATGETDGNGFYNTFDGAIPSENKYSRSLSKILNK